MTRNQPTTDGGAPIEPGGAVAVVRHLGRGARLDELEPWIAELRNGDTLVRHVRGDRMRTKADLFAQLSTALQLPLWCGVTWDGLYDVLVTNAGLPLTDGLDLVILHAQLLLDQEPEQRETFRLVIADVARAWGAEPDGVARRLGPAPVRVHLVLTDLRD